MRFRAPTIDCRTLAGPTRRTLMLGGLLFACLRGGRAQGIGPGGRAIYVSPDGSDEGPGTLDAPFATITAALKKTPRLGAGDTVIVLPGTYAEQVIVTPGGNSSGYFTLRSLVPHGAKIRSPKNTYSAIAIVNEFVSVEGFDVQAGGDGHGIEATFINGDPKQNGPSHIRVAGNLSHDNAGSGISLSYGDFYIVEDNICHGNCATNSYQGSGISVYAPRAVDGDEMPFRIIIRRNISRDNMAIKLPGEPEPQHSDGNGIIYDDSKNSQQRHPAGAYRYRTLIENNLCYRNGGRGVHVFLSDHAIIRNNTCCYNNRDPKNPASWRGELSNVDSSDCKWVNNIGVADPTINRFNTAIMDGSTPTHRSVDVLWQRNLTFNGMPGNASVNQSPARGFQEAYPDNLFGVDPKFLQPEPSAKEPDFRVDVGSPARATGVTQFGTVLHDLSGRARPPEYVAIGALQPADD